MHPWVGKIPWKRKWQPTLVFLPEEFHGKRSLEGYGPWVCKEAKMTDPLSTPLDKMLGPRRHSPFLNKAPKEGLQGFQISLLITDFITNKCAGLEICQLFFNGATCSSHEVLHRHLMHLSPRKQMILLQSMGIS